MLLTTCLVEKSESQRHSVLVLHRLFLRDLGRVTVFPSISSVQQIFTLAQVGAKSCAKLSLNNKENNKDIVLYT